MSSPFTNPPRYHFEGHAEELYGIESGKWLYTIYRNETVLFTFKTFGMVSDEDVQAELTKWLKARHYNNKES